MNKQDISGIKQLFLTQKNIVIVPHKNPDGDAMGSTLGLYHYLKKYHHNAKVISPNDYPAFLKWIPGDNTVLKYDSDTEMCHKLIADADIIFTLDFNALHRTGGMESNLEQSKAIKILIDHHQEPHNYASYIFSDVSKSSTCEMVYDFITMLEDHSLIDSDIATCLYLGIMTDTGSFRFPSTTSTTHRIIADLIEKGANNTFIHNQVYDTNSHERLQLLGCALSNLKVIPELKTAYISLSQDELNKYHFKKGDTEGFVNYGLSLENIVFAAIFIENKQEGIIKISFRSKGSFSVNDFSRAYFNGGGHINAAGGISELSLNETIKKFISILPNYSNALNDE
ncbi:MAG: bifunctional oligoribonuclease/PAP phosphatase NrnA [Flavobacteriales bacterium]|nr:bifunctional oligoribonuclease/PAP phosphatase NrnA [Flavobacteriia bacterium]NCP06586.1 bifunctional oligoribonuclease/PAP phosphatase NrnA [Flavobacteriales bacterium]PIV94734.1 MAG: DHH family phosphoesterase [Flavobacteriaceae bacterium CG17_big_fil_post_rev_8_21_14_2_50_33_15]PIY13495.1 MAG: DHH family phosphoesterase [Flavobacteriaceae bacterium CG_4_10_14_3_um_filter_33_47]PJB16913.1 MAG: DHH family phosphoesterase [Flavobacteriaceae bacterium CG_4_9_14_3_um_filter_33_16]